MYVGSQGTPGVLCGYMYVCRHPSHARRPLLRVPYVWVAGGAFFSSIGSSVQQHLLLAKRHQPRFAVLRLLDRAGLLPAKQVVCVGDRVAAVRDLVPSSASLECHITSSGYSYATRTHVVGTSTAYLTGAGGMHTCYAYYT